MRVAFNAQYLLEPQTGTGRYVANLLSALGRVDGINEYVVFTPEPPPQEFTAATPSTFVWEQAHGHMSGYGGRHIEKVYWEQRVFPRAARRADAKVMHVPHFAPPLSRPRQPHGIPRIVTIHDLANLALPEYRANARAHAYSQVVALAARQAAAVIAPSAFARSQIVEHLGIAPERVVTILEAPAPGFRRVTDPERLASVRARYGVCERYVLNVGGLDARKNIPMLIGAFAAVAHELNDPTLQLFIAGDPMRLGTGPAFPDWRPLLAHFGITNQVLCQPVAEEDLPALYSGAACFVFTSRYEGFGLTPLEAMACGAPVICSDAASLPEVVGTAGILVDASDPDDVGAAMARILTDAETRADYAARGLARVHQFSWDRAAAETSALYAEVSGMSHA